MVQKHLSLAEAPTPADAADGVALALCHLFRDSSENVSAWVRGGVGRKHSD